MNGELDAILEVTMRPLSDEWIAAVTDAAGAQMDAILGVIETPPG